MKLHRASTHAPVKLEQELGRGGEGAVFAVHGAPDLVAKIYTKPPSPEKIEKLAAMARVAKPALVNIAAWPTDLLLDDKRVARGFLMRKISSRSDLHELYSPKSRASEFPDTDFRFLVRATTNIARAFALVHSHGHVIGDVNHGNALVGRDGTVALIDCDSFQIRDRVRVFSCDVGVPLFTAPELQGKPFRGLRRSANHDAFGLAVIIFHMLFQGRHPFAGVYEDGEITIEQAIAEHRFAYSMQPEKTRMKQPPGTLALTTFGGPIAELFRRAFEQSAAQGERPSAIEWIHALQALEQTLKACPRSPRHYAPSGGPCCWCTAERRTGLQLFGRRAALLARSTVADVEGLWRAILEISHPGPAPAPKLEPATTQLSIAHRVGRQVGRMANVVAAGSLLVGLIAFFAQPRMWILLAWLMSIAVWILSEKSASRRRIGKLARAKAENAWQAAITLWKNECSGARFDAVMAELKQTRLELTLLAKRRKQELQRALEEANQHSLRKYLSAIPIDHLPVNYLTSSQRKKLADHGIKTAADVDRDQAIVPMLLSKKAAQELLAWYRMHARAFQPLQPEAERIAAIETRFNHLEQQLAKKLSDGPERLRTAREETLQSRVQLEGKLRKAWQDLSRAQQE